MRTLCHWLKHFSGYRCELSTDPRNSEMTASNDDRNEMLEELGEILWRSKNPYLRFTRWFFVINMAISLTVFNISAAINGANITPVFQFMAAFIPSVILTFIAFFSINWFLIKLAEQVGIEDRHRNSHGEEQLKIWMDQIKVRFQIILIFSAVSWVIFILLIAASRLFEFLFY